MSGLPAILARLKAAPSGTVARTATRWIKVTSGKWQQAGTRHGIVPVVLTSEELADETPFPQLEGASRGKN